MILVTGGAGFVGSNLAMSLARRHRDWEVVVLDNLHRKGSELNVPRLEEAGVRFVRGDVREPEQLAAIGPITALVECSAEPSAMSGIGGDTAFVYHTNMTGAYNCLELARLRDAYVIFLSTSRVYPAGPLNELNYEEGETRFELSDRQGVPGASAAGISEEFPLTGARTLYGTTKLAAELLIEEYRAAFGLRAVIDRCGVIAGPWQMGKVDQGVFTHWMLCHHFGLPLSYIGYGGTGKQVRDLLHVDDLVDLIELQLLEPDRWDGLSIRCSSEGRAMSRCTCRTARRSSRTPGGALGEPAMRFYATSTNGSAPTMNGSRGRSGSSVHADESTFDHPRPARTRPRALQTRRARFA
jgi:CDP-paratose 2-epimerase